MKPRILAFPLTVILASSAIAGQFIWTGGTDSTWTTQIADVGLRDRGDDADDDGFSNLQEFHFGTPPIAGNGSLVTTTSGGKLFFRIEGLEN